MKDVQKLLRPVYYFNNGIYYQVDTNSKVKLIKKNKELKNFIVLDITQNKIYSKDEFISVFVLDNHTTEQITEYLDTLRFKVYRKIKLNKEN